MSGKVCQFINELLNEVKQLRIAIRETLAIIPDGSYQLFLFFGQFDFFFSFSHCDYLFNLTSQRYYEFSY